jgi:myo-inositol-1-phosphate synthase
MPSPIRIAIVGVGNCASSLVQGLAYYGNGRRGGEGVMRQRIGGYGVADLLPVAAFDVDARKVGRSLAEAIFAPPNNTAVFCPEVGAIGAVRVSMGRVLDGVAAHMKRWPAGVRPVLSRQRQADLATVVKVLRESGAEVLVNYLPVGSRKASEFYAQACLKARVAMVNCIPVFLASDAKWAARFARAGLPIVGDDIKAQIGATITHRTLARLMASRGVKITSTYQLNTGGNTDFLNMLDRSRLTSKRQSKTQAVQSQLPTPLHADRIHIGPSDYIPFLNDNKVCFLRLEGEGFGGVPMNLELRLSVEDSPNSAACVVDAIRAAKLALDRGERGAVREASAWLMKHPPAQMPDDEAARAFDAWAKR